AHDVAIGHAVDETAVHDARLFGFENVGSGELQRLFRGPVNAVTERAGHALPLEPDHAVPRAAPELEIDHRCAAAPRVAPDPARASWWRVAASVICLAAHAAGRARGNEGRSGTRTARGAASTRPRRKTAR